MEAPQPLFDWREENGVWTASPDHRTVYACHRVTSRSSKHFARHNGISLGTKQTRIFTGSLDRCKALCEEHYRSKGGMK